MYKYENLFFLLFRKKYGFNKLRKIYFHSTNEYYNNLNDIKKEKGIFEKLVCIGNYNVENFCLDRELYEKYRECIKNDYEKIRKKLKEKKENEYNLYSKDIEHNEINNCNNNINIYESYLYDMIQNNDYKDILISDVIYENGKNILCIGEANLSFSLLLQKNLNSCKVVSTSMEDESMLIKKFGKKYFSKNLKLLENSGGIYIPNINVENLSSHFLKNTFDIIIFNFPFVLPTKECIEKKWNIKLEREEICTDHLKKKKNNSNNNNDNDNNKNNKNNDNVYIKYYKKTEYFLLNKLIYHLFKCASHLLKNKGFLHIRLNDKYLTCSFPKNMSLSFLEKIDFSNSYIIYKSLKYTPSLFDCSFLNCEDKKNKKKTKNNVIFTSSGKKIFKSFKMKHTSTLIFQKI
ncbi:conserved Plasmodium protein, unknown function [Plasmodium sp. gorilla clade G2]|uniref:conserved Plasmodium protein, unknown function n=1 Tax=Plasmodium sp. gorilla clade G2 TaxID=880535 RepID=UPI000D2203EE|nr:conserved Plasmodium protein, unknown function [Plasmodium sp. gorilla clade G2]SOV11420.1 conserved Plasmodium protein, unknown function [Plasmodium sp. gorilla clade G2]